MEDLNCVVCGEEFTPVNRNQKFCSRKCSNVDLKNPRECVVCGKKISRYNEKLCSRECRYKSIEIKNSKLRDLISEWIDGNRSLMLLRFDELMFKASKRFNIKNTSSYRRILHEAFLNVTKIDTGYTQDIKNNMFSENEMDYGMESNIKRLCSLTYEDVKNEI